MKRWHRRNTTKGNVMEVRRWSDGRVTTASGVQKMPRRRKPVDPPASSLLLYNPVHSEIKRKTCHCAESHDGPIVGNSGASVISAANF
jgi:hypothetical protein